MPDPTELTLPIAPDDAGRWVVAGLDTTLTTGAYDAYFLRCVRAMSTVRTDDVLIGAGEGVAWSALTTMLAEHGARDLLTRAAHAERLFAWMGLGELDLSSMGEAGGEARVSQAHLPRAWRPAWGPPQEAVCFFTQGWLSGAAAAVLGRPLRSLHSSHPACAGHGAPECRFLIAEGPGDTAAFLPPPSLPAGPAPQGGALARLRPRRGVLRVWDQPVSRVPLAWYVRVSSEIVRRLAAADGAAARERAERLLVEAAHHGGFALLGGALDGISDSQERLDRGIQRLNLLGLGRFQIAHQGDEQLIIRLDGDREASIWRALYGESLFPISWRARGLVQALADQAFLTEPDPVLPPWASCLSRSDRFVARAMSSAAMSQGTTAWTVTRGR